MKLLKLCDSFYILNDKKNSNKQIIIINNDAKFLSLESDKKIDFNDANNIIIKSKINKIRIKVNKKDIELLSRDIINNYELIIEYFESNINNFIKYISANSNNLNLDKFFDVYNDLKEIALYLINKNNNKNSNIEIKNKVIFSYNKLKNSVNNIGIKSINKNNKLSEATKLIIDYTKDSKIRVAKNKHKNIIKKKILENRDIIKELNNINKIKNKNNIEEESEYVINSCGFFTSTITLTNWLDEIECGGAMGLLVKVTSSDIAKLGISNFYNIESVTTTFIPIIDFIDSAINYFNKNNFSVFGNIDNANIIDAGNILGAGNAVIPLYINKFHWKISRIFLKPMLGMMLAHNPLGYHKKHENIIYSILVNLITKLFTEDNLNINWIKCFISYLRTCAEISFERKYNRGIKNHIKNFIDNPENRLINSFFDFDNIIAQSICTGYIMDNHSIKKLIKYFLEEFIRVGSNVINRFYIDDSKDLVRYILNNDSSKMINDIVSTYEIKLLASFYKMNILMNKIISIYGSYNKFMKTLEINYGLIKDEDAEKIITFIKNDIKMIPEIVDVEYLYDIIGENYKENNFKIGIWIVQGFEHSKAKKRRNAIKKKKYIDVQRLKNNEDYKNIMNSIIYNKKIKFKKKNKRYAKNNMHMHDEDNLWDGLDI